MESLLAVFMVVWIIGFVWMILVGFFGNRQLKKKSNFVTKGEIVTNWFLTLVWALIPFAGALVAGYVTLELCKQSEWWEEKA